MIEHLFDLVTIIHHIRVQHGSNYGIAEIRTSFGNRDRGTSGEAFSCRGFFLGRMNVCRHGLTKIYTGYRIKCAALFETQMKFFSKKVYHRRSLTLTLRRKEFFFEKKMLDNSSLFLFLYLHVLFFKSNKMMINVDFSYKTLILILFVVFSAAILFFLRIRPLRIQKSVPGIKSYPVIGFLGYAVKNWNEWPSVTANLCHKYNKTWGGSVPNFGGLPGAYFYIHQEETLKHVLSDIDTYIKGNIWKNVLGELLGNGIFVSDGNQWKLHRKLMSNMFSRNLLRHHAKITQMKLFQIVRQFQGKIRSRSSPFNIDIQDVFFRLTFDITTLVTFGIDLDRLVKRCNMTFHWLLMRSPFFVRSDSLTHSSK